MRIIFFIIAMLICGNVAAQQIISDPTPDRIFGTWTTETRLCETISLPPGTVTKQGAYASSPTQMNLMIVKKNSIASVDVVSKVAFNHPGGGWADIAIPFFTVPSTGTYLMGWSSQADVRDYKYLYQNVLRSAGDISGNGAIVNEINGFCLSARVTYDGAPPPPRTALFIVEGQSNSADTVCEVNISCTGPLYTFRHGVACKNLNINTGLVTTAVEPLLGTDNIGSSWVSRFCDLILDRPDVFTQWDTVIVAPIAKDSSFAADWAAGGQHNGRITTILVQAAAIGVPVSGVIWQQGEADKVACTSQAPYQASLQSVIATHRNAGYAGPIWVSLSSYYVGMNGCGKAIRAAQTAVVNGTNVLRGGDTDAFGTAYRQPDNGHFNSAGANAVSMAEYAAVFTYFAGQ